MLRKFALSILATLLLITPAALADPASPIEITNTDTPDPVASGQQLTYTITMVNTGGARVDNVSLADQLNGVGGIGVPPQLQITSTRGSCSQTTTLVTCNAGSIEGRGSWTVTIRGIVTAANGTVINNTATVAGAKSAQNFNTTLTISTDVSGGAGSPLADLTISKNGPTAVQVSSPMTYTLTVNNIGKANATDVRVVDTVPAGLTSITATGTSLFVCSVAGQTVTCIGGAVNQGANATITINAISPSVAGTITNTAAVDPDNTIAEANELNNTSALVNTNVTLDTPPPALLINTTDDPAVLAGAGPDPVIPGALLTFKTLVVNPSEYRADDVEIVVGTQGLEAASIAVDQVISDGTVGNSGGCWVTASETRCRARTLQPSGTILMTVTGRVILGAGSTMITTARVSGNIRNTGVMAQDTELTTVKPEIDLTVTKTDTPDPVCASSWPGTDPAPPVCRGGLKYTFVVGNSGIVQANNVLLRDPLPAGTYFDSFFAPAFSGGCSVNSDNILTCTGGTIPPESTTTLWIMLVAPPGTGTVLNTVTVDPNNAIFEADETNNTATASTLVITGIDLKIEKVDSPPGFDPIATNGTQTYTITVDNIGTQNATNIRVRDTLPADTRFRSVQADNGFTCSHSAGTVECIGGSILGTASEFYPPFGAPGNDTATITIRIFAQPTVTNAGGIGTMHNEVRVDPLGEIAEANEANNFEFEDTIVTTGGASIGAFNQFTIGKEQLSPANPVARNAKVIYKITVVNDGTDPATNITVRDYLPAGSRYIEATGTNEFNCSQVSNYIDCTGGEIAAGGSAAIHVSMFAPDTPGTYTNQAIVDPDGAIPEGNEFDNQAFVNTEVKNAGNGPFYELSIDKSQVSPANDVARNAIVTYSIVVTNGGSDSVTGVTVRDMLPAGSRYIEATGTNQFLCTHSGGVVDCLGGQIGAGLNATITVKMFAPDTPGTYINQAIADPDNTVPEGDEENNRDHQETIVKNGGNGAFNDLQIIKSATPTTTPMGDITYGLTITNAGTDPVLNVSVRDLLPAGAVFVSAADNDATGPAGAGKFTCSESAGIVDCTGATLDALTDKLPDITNQRHITIKVKAPNAILPQYRNQAFVDPDNVIPEGDELNNSATAVTNVQSLINLKINKDGPSNAEQSQVKDYTLKVKNEAPGGTATNGQTAFGVKVHDPLPVGLIPLAVNAGTGNNFACQILENPINVVDCIGDLNPEQEVTITITVFVTAENNRSLDNEACVDPADEIPEYEPPGENDNCSTVTTPIGPAPKRHPDLEVKKTASAASVTPGQDLTYTIGVKNIGDAAAQDPVTITDEVPSQTTFVSASGSGWTCNAPPATTVTCTLAGGLAAGATAGDITIVVNVSLGAEGSISNTAVAAAALSNPGETDAENEFILDNNNSMIVTAVGEPKFDLAIASLVDAPDPAERGKQLVYTVNAINTGVQAANGVIVRLTPPPADTVILIEAPSGTNGFTCGSMSGTSIDCTGNLAPGAQTAIAAKFLVTLSAPPELTFEATIDPGHVFPEAPADLPNNTRSVTTTIFGGTCLVPPCADLAAAQLKESADPIAVGNAITYTFVVANIGGVATALAPGQSLLWLDLFGDVTSAVPASSDAAITCAVDGYLAGDHLYTSCTGNLNPGASVTVTLTVTANGGTLIQARGLADPFNLIAETSDFEPPIGPVSSYGNNRIIEATTVTP